jgi:hypothetical protein
MTNRLTQCLQIIAFSAEKEQQQQTAAKLATRSQ